MSAETSSCASDRWRSPTRPSARGIPLTNWSWDGVEGSETSGDVTWGAYAVQGTYDGEEFAVTQPPIMLALYDPMPFPDPTERRARRG